MWAKGILPSCSVIACFTRRSEMPQTGDRRPAAAIEIFPAGGIVDIDTIAVRHRRHGTGKRAVKDMCHRVKVSPERCIGSRRPIDLDGLVNSFPETL